MEIQNYWYDNLGTAHYKKQNGGWSHMFLDKMFFVDTDESTKSTIFNVMKSKFGSLEKLSKHTEIITDYMNYLHKPLVGIKFDNTKQSVKPYFDQLKELKRRDMVIYGENIFRYGILTDPNITINNSRVRIWFLDIEIDNFSSNSDLSMQQIVDNALSKLISITIYDSLAKKYIALVVDPDGNRTEQLTQDDNKIIQIFKSEKQLIKFFVQLLKDTEPYVISGWYSNEFDIPFLINKVKNELNDQSQMSLIDGLEADIYIKKSNNGEIQHFNKMPGIELIDYMDLYLKYSGKNPPSKSLDGVAKFEGISGKTESKGFLNYYDDFQKFIDYIFRDVEVLVELENSKRLIKMITALQELVKIPLSQIMHTSRMVEQMIYHSTFNDNIVIPSYVRYQGNAGYQGAIVLDPEDKTFDNVVVLDYASLYPNTIITFNISPDTLLKGKQLDEAKQKGIPCSDLTSVMDGEKVGYRLDFMGMIPKAVKMLIDKRMEYKQLYKTAQDDDPNKVEYDLKQWNYKIIINSIYGYLGYRFSPLFDVTVSSSVTAQSRYMLTTCVDLVNTSPTGATVIYGDTDSQFSVLNNYKHKENANKEEIEKVQHTLSNYINNQILNYILKLFYNIEKNKIQNTLQVDVDKIFKKLRLFGVKKRYYGVDFNDNEIFHGIELARSDTPQSVKPTLSDFFKKQLYNKLTKEELLTKYEEISKFTLEDIGIPKSITQLNLDNYKVIPGHVRGMLFAKQIGINIPDVITDKLLQIPVVIFKEYNPELFDKAKEIFNLKSKKATELNCIISTLPDLLEETIEVIQKLDKFIKIDYFTFYDKQVLEKMTQFTELRPVIEEVRTQIMQQEYKDKQGKNLMLFSIG